MNEKRRGRKPAGKKSRKLRSIHRNIQTLRKARNWTQEDLATRCGVDKTAVSQWERGLSAPKGARLPKVAEAFETTIDALYAEAA